MASVMEIAEEKYPELINCLGRIDPNDFKCNECKWVYSCWLISQDLQRDEFQPGKYRAGFGKKTRDSKYDF